MHIAIVAGNFALVKDNMVIGVVTLTNETQWGFYPLVSGSTSGCHTYVPLHHALQEALKFKPD